jgi:CheY-like chemotaxis protein/thioredoxin-like negative regulator of GroEL
MRQIDIIKLYSLKRCLIIEDMPDVRVAIAGILRLFGVQEIDVVANGDQAIEACETTLYQLVLCDYNLGSGKDGQQILEELRFRNRLYNTSIFIMLTAETSREMVLGALEYQPDDYVAKPITQVVLRQRLDRVILRHQELYGIKQAIDDKNYVLADQLCQDKLNEDTHYRGACLHIQAEMNLRLANFDRAEEIYSGVLEKRLALWAKLGLGKTKLLKKEYEAAERNLKAVIAVDSRVVEAYDLLADTYIGQKDLHKAQQIMQAAAEISPKSVMRQRRLAAIAKLNSDSKVCLEANRQVIKSARNSCFESPNDYITLARELTDLSGEQDGNRDNYVKESFEVLQRLAKKDYFDSSADVQANALRSRSLMNQNKVKDAESYLEKAKQLYQKKNAEMDESVGLEFARSLIANGDKNSADQVLVKLITRFPDNRQLSAEIDAMSDIPKSEEGRKRVAEMTKAGIAFYDKGDFAAATDVFKDAVVYFPSHVGLNLNLIQVVVAEVKKNGNQAGFEKVCRKALVRISSIDEKHSQYERYKYLHSQVDDLFRLNLDGLDIEL